MVREADKTPLSCRTVNRKQKVTACIMRHQGMCNLMTSMRKAYKWYVKQFIGSLPLKFTTLLQYECWIKVASS